MSLKFKQSTYAPYVTGSSSCPLNNLNCVVHEGKTKRQCSSFRGIVCTCLSQQKPCFSWLVKSADQTAFNHTSRVRLSSLKLGSEVYLGFTEISKKKGNISLIARRCQKYLVLGYFFVSVNKISKKGGLKNSLIK